jgi:hypothetical protein
MGRATQTAENTAQSWRGPCETAEDSNQAAEGTSLQQEEGAQELSSNATWCESTPYNTHPNSRETVSYNLESGVAVRRAARSPTAAGETKSVSDDARNRRNIARNGPLASRRSDR